MKLLHSFIILFFGFYANSQISDFKHINFKKADSIALAYSQENLYNLPNLSHKLTANLNTDAERFRAIYRWVSANIANDYTSYLKNNRKRQRFKDDRIKLKLWNTSFRKQLFKKLLEKKQTICTGYAYLVKELADLANLECKIVQGYGRVSTTDVNTLTLPNHSWNAVKINGKWYLCDPTWASGIPDPETNAFKFSYNNGFFFTNPQLFAINHFPKDNKWWLLEKDIPSFEAFLKAPIIYGNAYDKLELHKAPTQRYHSIKKNAVLTFKYQLKENIDTKNVTFLIDNGFNSIKVKPSSVAHVNKSLHIKYKFKKSGFFDVHLYIEESIIATYTIEVTSY